MLQCISSLINVLGFLTVCSHVFPSCLVGNRKVVRQEAERGRGDPVGDRPEAEASDGSGGC